MSTLYSLNIQHIWNTAEFAELIDHWSWLIMWRLWVRSKSAVRPIGTEWCGTGRAFGKSCRIDLIVLRISERLLPVMMEFQAATNFSRKLSRSVWHRLLRLFTSIEIKNTERSVFGDRSKLPTEPTHFRTLWMRSDQTPPTFRPFTERVFLRSDRSDRTDRRFRTHPLYQMLCYISMYATI